VTKKVSRDAGTGEFVTEEHAEANPETTVTETIEGPDAQLFEFKQPEEEAPYHTILESWREVLKPAKEERTKAVTPQWGSLIVNTFKEVTYAQMNDFRDLYYDLIEELYQILVDEIETDENCLTYSTAAEDVEHNSVHYKVLLTQWQATFLMHELAWDCTDPLAGAKIGALSKIHEMFFADVGIVAYLDKINFEFTEDDQAELAKTLTTLKEAK
jgi:hypothetical protein